MFEWYNVLPEYCLFFTANICSDLELYDCVQGLQTCLVAFLSRYASMMHVVTCCGGIVYPVLSVLARNFYVILYIHVYV